MSIHSVYILNSLTHNILTNIIEMYNVHTIVAISL